MQAIVQRRYGPPEILEFSDVATPPEPDDGRVRVRVRAASVNALDWRRVRADPFVLRLGGEFRRPKVAGLGVDAAGVIDAVGPGETDLRVGDEVFGLGRRLVRRVDGRPDLRAQAREPHVRRGGGRAHRRHDRAPGRARQGPRPGRSARAGDRRGRRRGHVRGSDRPCVRGGGDRGHEHGQGRAGALDRRSACRGLPARGRDARASAVRRDPRRRRDAVDRFAAARPCTDGTYVLVGAGHGRGGPIARLLAAVVRQKLLRQRVIVFISKENREDLQALAVMLADRRIRSVIDRTYPLAQTVDAVRYVEGGQAAGKVVITIPVTSSGGKRSGPHRRRPSRRPRGRGAGLGSSRVRWRRSISCSGASAVGSSDHRPDAATSTREAVVPPTMSRLNLIRSRPSGWWPYGAGKPQAPRSRLATSIVPSSVPADGGIQETSRSWLGRMWARTTRSRSAAATSSPWAARISAVSTMSPEEFVSPLSGFASGAVDRSPSRARRGSSTARSRRTRRRAPTGPRRRWRPPAGPAMTGST